MNAPQPPPTPVGADRHGLPAPLVQHLAAAVEVLESGARFAPLGDTDRFPWPCAPTDADRALARAVANAPSVEMALALRLEAAARLSEMLDGLKRYQTSPHCRTLDDPKVVWRQGSARLLDFGADQPGGRPLLVAPSLINSHHVLDLDHDWSLVRHLAANGLRPFLLDWGEPLMNERSFTLSDYLAQRLIPAFDLVRQEAGGGKVPLLGYCMGGTLTIALSSLRSMDVERIALIGSPWDFSHMTPMRSALAALGVAGEPSVLSDMINRVGACFGAIPMTALQVVFAQLDPGLAARKFRRFARLPETAADLRKFVLIEDWLNAGPALSAPAAKAALIDWHLDNTTMRGTWKVNGQLIRPETVAAPTLICAATEDRITPPRATEALAAIMPNVRISRPKAGHVGMVVGSGAPKSLWSELTNFFRAEAL
ncbi:MAG: alpha/beta fold hydrolase [Pseudomonadota bacterium]